MPSYLPSSIAFLFVFALSLWTFVRGFKTQKEVHEIKKDVEKMEFKLDQHMHDTSEQNKRTEERLKELPTKKHNENGFEDIKQFIKEIGIAETKKALTDAKS